MNEEVKTRMYAAVSGAWAFVYNTLKLALLLILLLFRAIDREMQKVAAKQRLKTKEEGKHDKKNI